MFLGEASKIEAVKEIFTGLYSLDFDEFGDQAIQMALDSPERYVSFFVTAAVHLYRYILHF